MSEVLLAVEGLTKAFDSVTVVDQVSFEVRSGEVVALVGQNGSGKSTLLKMIAGFYTPTQGTFRLPAHRSQPRSGSDPQSGGGRIAFVHQDLALVPDLDITENLALGEGLPRKRLGRVDWRRARARATDVIKEFGISGTPKTPVADLSPTDKALVAIGRALTRVRNAQGALLVMDEPTASLPEGEAQRVLGEVRRVVGRGAGVLYVSHRLQEVMSLADRVLVLRNGHLVASRPVGQLKRSELVELMLGRVLASIPRREPGPAASSSALVKFQSVSGRILSQVSCSVAAGEIVGVTGLLGSGKSELGRLLAGVSEPRAGRILIDGQPAALASPRKAVRAGIGYVPPDRRHMGGIMNLSAIENVTLPDLRSFRRFRHVPWLDKPAEAQATLDWMDLAGVVPPRPSQNFAEFSGGNQQKLVYGRWIRLSPRIFVLDEPTQGVDVGAIKDLYEIIRRHAESGAAVLLISSEWEDLPRICHRVIVLERGRIVAELADGELTEDSLTAAALGHFADGSSEFSPEGSEA